VATVYFALLKCFIFGPYGKFSVSIFVLLPGIKTVALLCVFSVFLEEGRQCTCNVTLRRVRAAIVTVGNQYYLVSVSVALVIQHALGMLHIAICGLSGSTLFFHVIS